MAHQTVSGTISNMLHSRLRRDWSHARTTSLRPDDGIRPLRYDLTSGKLSKGGIPVRLNGMPLKILGYLLERPGELASRKDLQLLLWNGTAYAGAPRYRLTNGIRTSVTIRHLVRSRRT